MAASSSITTVTLVALFLAHFPSFEALYEDQVGKFDWRQQYVGNIKQCIIEHGGTRRHIFVSTDANVLAGIHAKTGNVAWRHIFRQGDIGVINALIYTGQELVTVTGNGFAVRMWDPSSGVLQWETLTSQTTPMEKSQTPAVLKFNEENSAKKPRIAVTYAGHVSVVNIKNGEELWKDAIPNSDSVQDFLLQVSTDEDDDGVLVVIGRVPGIGFRVVRFNAKDGSVLGQTQIPSPWVQEDTKCITLSGDKIVCADTQSKSIRIATVKPKQQTQSGFISVPLIKLQLQIQDFRVEPLEKFSMDAGDHQSFVLRLNEESIAWVKLDGDDIRIIQNIPSVLAHSFDLYKEQYMLTTASEDQSKRFILLQSFSKDGEVASLKNRIQLPTQSGSIIMVSASHMDKKDKSIGSRVLVKTSDEGLHLIQQGGQITWSREESLASALSVEMVDLPVSETEAQFEDEFGTKKGDNIFSMFARRISTQMSQLQSYFVHLKKKIESFQHGGVVHHGVDQLTYAVQYESDETMGEYLTRDEFSLHKIIIVATKPGKVFGLDSEDGAILWSYFLPNVAPIERGGKLTLPLMIQRTTAHFPNPPQCTIIAKSKDSDKNVIFSFNPINGKPSLPEYPVGQVLPNPLRQATMQNIVDLEFMKVIVLLDKDNKVSVYPSTAESIVAKNMDKIYLFTADSTSGALNGYRLLPLEENELLKGEFHPIFSAEEVWHVQLPSLLQRITHVVSKRPTEEVHSQGRVLGDRTVLYKYLNPNLVVVISEGEDATAKSHVTVYLIDVVTGNIVFQTDHKRVEGPVHVVHSENWVVYHFWNNRFRRNEVTVLELFEGKSQKNSTAFSSLDPPSAPLVERQSYVFSEALQAITTTQTEKGITSKHVLMVLQSGGIVSLPKRILDPRRPLVPTQQHKEEGLIPYTPELVVPQTAYINYNQSVFGVRSIHTSPAGLESTCLVLAYGLDFYFTRATPSNLFDVLKEDFDYLLIGTVLIGLLVAAIVTRRLASMKALRQAWQ
ncbi:ER membrane protein complex subunit 1 [Holothuria leucospilota]|uniref:ER membrane protein complex subunit 1 n=1 Tax=Holothuria leucospilota TaxID=206669 RepID=A0A9Q1BCQ6_HOLLE|nr:ER membrane protein complex subunit 1 [Holothuria leucospilota]